MNLSEHSSILIVVVPLIASFLNVFIGLWRRSLCYPLFLLALVICGFLSIDLIQNIINNGTIRYKLGGWMPPWGIEYVVDHLNAYVILIVSFISLLVAIYSKRSLEKELEESKLPYFYSTYLLLVTGLLGITVTGDIFNLFVFLEIASLAGYALIAIGENRSVLASFNYIIMGTIGACFYLLGVGYIYIITGSLNMLDIAQLLPKLYESKVTLAAFAFLVVGVAIKIALFPLHRWLPDAYTYAPSAVSVLASATMTKVGIYVLIRISFTIFEPNFSKDIIPAGTILVWWSTIAIIFGSILALGQIDFKRTLSYILIAEVGYMVLGVNLGNKEGFIGAVLHILNDALMIACLFMVTGGIYYYLKSRNIEDFVGLNKKMPLSMASFSIVALSMIGIPPTAGFFSKWYLIIGAIKAEQWIAVIALLFSSLVNAIIFFRILEKIYFKKGNSTKDINVKEVPVSMLIPILILATSVILVGLFSGKIISSIIQFTVPGGF
ncbi:MAG: monovalent cation/H+ antiporter subunit D family protein [Thermodesulfovibrio sp.]|uniref:monovalent cation/H+ antiporter subunit D family protein n=1 Tax=unclassified Thermodesulfovibrio TaxID=2645936 RepID=UPI0008591983|nr:MULTISPECIES: monovalent cation/H+ antiporter subunit D family protein [unclassified Thermodesulfovibrio]MDI1472254.1 monovalent cation/H+ antiporter subunit D family protein [Thermodesulfovibrio sp. 1176]MDI6714116.1 monovalent cation/H+ antiporter subunit D family protein [Thermodesulfovibrio sp.]ODA44632.1 sodium- potassium/hydrogen antiporter subunit D [Thermodesulfovibrio sp. N1]